MLRADELVAIYALLEHGQTVDPKGAPVDCGERCDKFCCRPGNTTKYLLPGEREFLESAMRERGDPPFAFKSLYWFESLDEPPTRACACEPLRELRPFNCRVFPYSPRLEGRRVVGLKKSRLKYLEPCWIEEPAPAWQAGAVQAWQRVLDDTDSRLLFCRLGALWEWNQASERGEEAGHALVALAQIRPEDDDDTWARAARFFSRTD